MGVLTFALAAPKVSSSECKASMEEQAESRLEMMAREVARQEAQRAVEACMARQAAEEEAAAIGAKEEATLGAEQEGEEAAVGAEEAQAEMDKKARLYARWVGQIEAGAPTLHPGLHIGSRVKPLGEGLGTLGHAALGPVARRGVVRAVADLATRTPRGLPDLPLGHVRP